MRMSKISRIAVTGAAASMALVTAAPALACQTSETTEPKPASQQVSLAQQKASLDAFLTRSQQQLDALASKIAADTKLTSAQQSAWASWIADEQAKLAALKSAVDAANTLSELHQAVHSAMLGSGWFGWYGAFGTERERIATELRSMDSARDAQRRHPLRAGQAGMAKHASTVVLRSGTDSNGTDSRQLPAGQHRSNEEQGNWQWNRGYQARHGFGDYRRGYDRDAGGYDRDSADSSWTDYHR